MSDNSLMEKFEQEVWSKVPHREEKDGKVENVSKNTKSYIAAKIAKKIIDKLLINDKNTN